MATTTFQVARREFAQYLGYGDVVGKDQLAWSTTTNITTDNLVISTELRDAGFDDLAGIAASGDDQLAGLWLYLVAGTGNNVQASRVTDLYDASAGQITVRGIALVAESGSVDFELHRYNPTALRDALNRARVTVFPLLHVPVTRTLFTAQSQVRYDVPAAIVDGPDRIYLYKGIPVAHANNILTNGDFENFTAGVPDSWTATTLDTAEEVVTTSPFNYARIDGSSVRCTSQTGNVGTLLQSISSPGTHSGQRISFQIWVYCLTADVVSTAIKIGGTTHLGSADDGGLHKGTGWELLTHFEDSTITISSLDIGISVVSGAADNTEFYIDSAVAVVGPLQEPETDPTELFDWDYREDVQGTTLRQEVVFQHEFPDLCLLRFEGKGYLSSVSAEADTFKIGAPQTDLLYAQAAVELFKREQRSAVGSNRESLAMQLRSAEDDVERFAVHRLSAPRLRMRIPA